MITIFRVHASQFEGYTSKQNIQGWSLHGTRLKRKRSWARRWPELVGQSLLKGCRPSQIEKMED